MHHNSSEVQGVLAYAELFVCNQSKHHGVHPNARCE